MTIEEFKNPPDKYRPLQLILSYEQCFGETEEVLRTNLLRVRELGVGGLVVTVNQQQYLRSEKAWEVLRLAIRISKELGFRLWLYDEEGYPSGAAGGLVLERDPGVEALGLIQRLNGTREVEYEIAPLYEETHATENFYQKRHYINILEPRATSLFIEVTHEQYAIRLGKLEQWFEAIFTDEPSLISAYVPKGKAYPSTLPWSRSLPEIFRARKGYDLMQRIRSLYQNVGDEDRKIRCDFYDVISELCAENYFGQIQNWCKEHGIASSGHLLGEETLVWQTYFEGNPFACYRRMDIPGIDMILSDPERIMHENFFLVPKLASSAARLTGKREVMCEISDFLGEMDHHHASLEQMMSTASILYALGITELVCMYGSPIFDVLGKLDANGSASHVIDGKKYRRYTEFVARLKQTFLQGKIETRVAVLHPIVSVWANFTPSNRSMYEPHPNERVVFIDHGFTNICRSLIQHQIDFDILDDKALAEAEIVNDTLVIAGNLYSCIVLPPMDTIRVQTAEKIAEYSRHGGFVVARSLIPEHAAEGLEENQIIRKFLEVIFSEKQNRVVQSEKDLIDAVKLKIDPNCELSPPNPNLLCTCLSTTREKIFFLANTSSRGWKGRCTAEASGNVTLFYPDSGQTIKVFPGDLQVPSTNLELSLDPFQSVFAVFMIPER